MTPEQQEIVAKGEYLGDGVYADFDGFNIWLKVGEHTAPRLVALEPQTLAALNGYAARINRVFARRHFTVPGEP